MKKAIISLVTMGFIILIGVVVYQLYFSLPSVLKEGSHMEQDILLSEEFYSDIGGLTKVFLLANQDTIGLVVAHKNKVGLWRKVHASIAVQPSEGEFITTGHGVMEIQNGRILSESHLYVAYFTEHGKSDEIKDPPNFDLEVNYFNVDDRVLLFAHGIARDEKDSFGLDEIITYLQSQIKGSHLE